MIKDFYKKIYVLLNYSSITSVYCYFTSSEFDSVRFKNITYSFRTCPQCCSTIRASGHDLILLQSSLCANIKDGRAYIPLQIYSEIYDDLMQMRKTIRRKIKEDAESEQQEKIRIKKEFKIVADLLRDYLKGEKL